MNALNLYHAKDIDLPVEQLFTSIFQLQILDEYDHITNTLKRELEKCFEETEEKDGKKRIKSIAYHPNGLCEWQNKTEKIILSPWKNKTETSNQIKRSYTRIKDANVIWYVQLMVYLKKPLRLKNEKLNIREIAAFSKTYNALSEEEKKLVADERAQYHKGVFVREMYKLRDFFKASLHHNKSMEYDHESGELRLDYKRFRLLSDAQLKDLKTLYESKITDYWTFEQKLNELLYQYVDYFHKDDELMPCIDFSDLLIPTKNKVKQIEGNWGYRQEGKMKYTLNFTNETDAALAILDRFSEVEDAELKKALKKLGI